MCAQSLAAIRDEVCRELGVPTKDVELSMGMSGDFEQAVRTIGTVTFALAHCMRQWRREMLTTRLYVADRDGQHERTCGQHHLWSATVCKVAP